MKKKVSLFLAIAVFCMALSTLLAPVKAQAAQASVLYENNFESNMNGWTTLGVPASYLSRTTEASYGSGSYSLKLSQHYDTWYSPQLNLYSLMKAMGPGTYAFSADVMATGSYTQVGPDFAFLMIRGNSSADKNSFIQQDKGSNNYFKRISDGVSMKPSQWHSFTGSVKVLASDLTRDTGNFMFCVDGVPSGGTTLYIDNVRIWRLSDEGITNGNFSSGTIGWRTWLGDSGTPSSLTVDSSLFASYIRVSQYSSIACNVDQILSHYGAGIYTIAFDLRIDSISGDQDPNVLSLYFTSNFSEYHRHLLPITVSSSNGWVRRQFDVYLTAEEFALLNPDEKEVHFRIECPAKPYRIEYSIRNVSLTPYSVSSAALPGGEQVLAVGQHLQLPSPVTMPDGAPGRVDWYSSNPSIATVDASGVVSGHSAGTVTITAKARSGGATASCTVAVKQVIGGFVGYGQERPHYCWLACAKSLAHTYARQHSDVTFNNTSLQAAYDATKLPELDGSYTETGDRYDLRRAINYFLSRTNYEYDCLKMVCINSTDNLPPLTQNQVTNLIDQGKPIIVSRWNVSNPQAWTEGHSFIIYGYTYKNSVLFLELYDPLRNNRLGGIYAASFSQIVSQGSVAWMEALYLK